MTTSITVDKPMLPVVLGENDLIYIREHPESFPRFYQVDQQRRVKNIALILVSCYEDKHFSSLEWIDKDAPKLEARISSHKYYRDLTFREICTALKNGTSGEYGECRAITIDFCLHCLDRYVHSNADLYNKIANKPTPEEVAYDAKRLRETQEQLAASMARANRERMEKENNFKKL